MNKLRLLLIALIFTTGAASAHEDRILTIRPDGSIPEIPASFGTVSLELSGFGQIAPDVVFSVGPNHNHLPPCLTKLIHTQRLSDVSVSGSWYHDESVLPYYVNVEFYEPGYVPGRPYNSSLNILFNLHTAQVIQIRQFVADLSGNGGQFLKVSLPKGCTLSPPAA